MAGSVAVTSLPVESGAVIAELVSILASFVLAFACVLVLPLAVPVVAAVPAASSVAGQWRSLTATDFPPAST